MALLKKVLIVMGFVLLSNLSKAQSNNMNMTKDVELFVAKKIVWVFNEKMDSVEIQYSRDNINYTTIDVVHYKSLDDIYEYDMDLIGYYRLYSNGKKSKIVTNIID